MGGAVLVGQVRNEFALRVLVADPRDEISDGGIILPEWGNRSHGEPLKMRVTSIGPDVPGNEIREGMVLWLDPNHCEDDRFKDDGVEYVSPRFKLFDWQKDNGALFGIAEADDA